VLIFIGSAVVVGGTAIAVALNHDDDPKTGWAWIDVVSIFLLVSNNTY
jgi:hypothetical protein